jgi:hypothetical protein
MRTFKANVYFQDEARRIGCGWRLCDVKVGRTLIHFVERATGSRCKLPKTIYVGQKANTRKVETLSYLRIVEVE